jgi:hypothetical protein
MRRHCSRLQGVAIASLALLLVIALPASHAGAAKLGIYFDASGTREGLDVAPFSVFTFYAVASGVGSGVVGYEFELEYSDDITILSKTVYPAGAFSLLSSNTSFLVATGGACHGGAGGVVLVSFTAMLLRDGSNLQLRASGLKGGSIDDDTPAYVPCDDDETVYGFDETPSSFVNPKTDSFGRVKERYDS